MLAGKDFKVKIDNFGPIDELKESLVASDFSE